MMLNDLTGKAVVVDGGVDSFGRAIGLSFAREGAAVWLVHREPQADTQAIEQQFVAAGASPPRFARLDPADSGSTTALVDTLRAAHDRIEVVVENAQAPLIAAPGLDGLDQASLFGCLEGTTWPLLGLLQTLEARFGDYPRYTVAISYDGPDSYHPGHEYLAASKAVLETFCRYLAKHLWEGHQRRVNVLRVGSLAPETLVATLGPECEGFLERFYGEDFFVAPEAVGDATLALCSGLLDAMNGRVVRLDGGAGFHDNLLRLFERRQDLGLAVGETSVTSGGT